MYSKVERCGGREQNTGLSRDKIHSNLTSDSITGSSSFEYDRAANKTFQLQTYSGPFTAHVPPTWIRDVTVQSNSAKMTKCL